MKKKRRRKRWRKRELGKVRKGRRKGLEKLLAEKSRQNRAGGEKEKE